MKQRVVSIIVPCYNEEENILEMFKKVSQVFRTVKGYTFELIYIDNDSTDNSMSVFKKLAKKDKRVKIIHMSRNFGSPQPSFLAGLSYATGDAAVLLHGDIQDPPEMITQFISYWEQGYDVVYGVRKKREGYGMMWNFYYKFFYWLLAKLAYIPIPLNAGEFSLITKRVIRELLVIEEYDYNLRCLRAFVGFKQIGIPYVRDARVAGKSTESFLSGVWWAKTIILNFSFKPLTIISTLGLIITLCSFLFLLINIILVFVLRHSAPGIPTVIVLISFLGGIQLLSLSIIAEYIAKIFLEVKRRPKYIIDETINFSHKK